MPFLSSCTCYTYHPWCTRCNRFEHTSCNAYWGILINSHDLFNIASLIINHLYIISTCSKIVAQYHLSSLTCITSRGMRKEHRSCSIVLTHLYSIRIIRRISKVNSHCSITTIAKSFLSRHTKYWGYLFHIYIAYLKCTRLLSSRSYRLFDKYSIDTCT